MGEGIRVAGLRLQGAGYRLQGTGRMRCRVQAANYKESYRSCLFGFGISQSSGFLWTLSFGSWYFPAVFLRISDFPVFGLSSVLIIWFFQKPYLSSSKNINTVL